MYTQTKNFTSTVLASTKQTIIDDVNDSRYTNVSVKPATVIDRKLITETEVTDPASAPTIVDATLDNISVYEFAHTYTGTPIYLTQVTNAQTFDCVLDIAYTFGTDKIYTQTVIINASGTDQTPTYFSKKALITNIIIDGTTYKITMPVSLDFGDIDNKCTVIQEITLVFKNDIWTCVGTADICVVGAEDALIDRLSSMDSNIAALETFQSAQGTTNTAIAASISALETSVNAGVSSTGSALFTTDDLFVEKAYGINMPTPVNSSTDMSFQIDGEDYRVRQGTYIGVFNDSLEQIHAHTVQNLFIDNGNWHYIGGYWNTFFINDTGDRVKLDAKQYDNTTGLYIGTDHITTTTDTSTYGGDFLEFINPFYFKISSLSWSSAAFTNMPLKSWLFGSNDGTDYVLIKEMLNDDSSRTVTHTINDTNKYKIIKFVVSEITPNTFGYRLTGLSFAGSAYDTLVVSTAEQLAMIDDIASDVATLSANQTTINAAQATTNTILQTNIDNTNTATAASITALKSVNTAQTTTNNNVAADITALKSVNTTQTTTNNDVAADITALKSVNTAQGATNTATATSIANLETFETTQGETNTATAASISALETLETSITSLESFETAQATINSSVESSLFTLQTNIDNVAPAAAANSKIEPLSSGTFAANKLAYTFDEKTIFMNQLVSDGVFDLALTISNPINNKSYIQKIIVDCLEFKGYVNALTVNGGVVIIRHEGGETINLAPIAGYSSIVQEMSLVFVGNAWKALSNTRLYYNSAINTYYDVTAPTITLTGSITTTHEVGSGAFSEPGYTGTDNIDGDITDDVVVTGSVNDAVIGSYTLYYNVDDAKGNSAIQKARVVDVIDTTAPVVVLVGDSVIALDTGTAWSDPGVTATDNSGETMTIVVGGDTLDVNTEGAYTITYTATDGRGNAGNLVSRLINVTDKGYALKWNNDAIDILELVDSYGKCNNTFYPSRSYFTTTILSGTAYLQGDYAYYCSSLQNNASQLRNVFSLSGSSIWASMTDTSGSFKWASHLYPGATTMTNFSGGFPYNRDASDPLPYQGVNMNSGSYNGLVYFSHTDSSTHTTFGGEFVEMVFPFFVDMTAFHLKSFNSTFTPRKSTLMGSKDGGTTYQIIETYTNQVEDMVVNYSDLPKFNAFKYVIREVSTTGWVAAIMKIKIYGKIYTLT